MNQNPSNRQEASVLHEIIFGKRATYLKAIDFTLPGTEGLFVSPEKDQAISIEHDHWAGASDYIPPSVFEDYQEKIRGRTIQRVMSSDRTVQEKLNLIDELRQGAQSRSVFHTSLGLLENVIQEMEDTDEHEVLRFGVPQVDALVGGIFKTTLAVISGETGMGKSQMASNIAYSALLAGKRVVYYDLENDPNDFMRRRIAFVMAQKLNTFVYHSDLRIRQRWEKYEPHVSEIAGKVADSVKGLSLYNNNKIPTVSDFISSMESVERADLVVIDHLHYFQMEEDRTESEQIGKIMRQLRVFTKSKRIPVIVVAHVRKRQGRGALGNDDLFGSSNIPKEAETVIMLSKQDGKIRLAVTKNRNTGITKSWICVAGKNYQFENLVEETGGTGETIF